MDFHVPIQVPAIVPHIEYTDSLFLIGSCFTEHIGARLKQHKFGVHENPHGILFDPISVCRSLISYIDQRLYTQADLFYLHELWHSWDHHSRFSGMEAEAVLAQINASQQAAHQALSKAKWLIITLGSSYSYQWMEEAYRPVANCHRAPAQGFRKHLLGIDETVAALDTVIHRLFRFNADIQIIFTISPVRHIRDGVIENNRSKARLIEAVHHLVQKFDRLHYFPAYELVVDVLRDYRFYDLDLVHPNYQATQFVFDHFVQAAMDGKTQAWMQRVKEVVTAYRHRPQQPDTQAHQKFLAAQLEKMRVLQQELPHLDWAAEAYYFSTGKRSSADHNLINDPVA